MDNLVVIKLTMILMVAGSLMDLVPQNVSG